MKNYISNTWNENFQQPSCNGMSLSCNYMPLHAITCITCHYMLGKMLLEWVRFPDECRSRYPRGNMNEEFWEILPCEGHFCYRQRGHFFQKDCSSGSFGFAKLFEEPHLRHHFLDNSFASRTQWHPHDFFFDKRIMTQTKLKYGYGVQPKFP